jgi:hypothetical protein
MRIYEYRMPRRVYPNAELCYARIGKISILCYDDSITPRKLISTVFWGDSGWTYSGEIQASPRDKFANIKQATAAAFYQYLSRTKSEN